MKREIFDPSAKRGTVGGDIGICLIVGMLNLILNGTVRAGEGPQNARQIVQHIDRLYRSETSYSRLEMRISTPNRERNLRSDDHGPGKAVDRAQGRTDR